METSLRDLLDSLDGRGLVIVDIDQIEEALGEIHVEIDDKVTL